VVLLPLVIVGALATQVLAQTPSPLVVDPGCVCTGWEYGCYEYGPNQWYCRGRAVFEHYDANGNPLYLAAQIEVTCTVKWFGVVMGSCRDTDYEDGYGEVWLFADCYIAAGTGWAMLCFSSLTRHCY